MPTDCRSVEGTPLQLVGAREYVMVSNRSHKHEGTVWHLPGPNQLYCTTECCKTGDDDRMIVKVTFSIDWPEPRCRSCVKAMESRKRNVKTQGAMPQQ